MHLDMIFTLIRMHTGILWTDMEEGVSQKECHCSKEHCDHIMGCPDNSSGMLNEVLLEGWLTHLISL